MAAWNLGVFLLMALVYLMTNDVNGQEHLGCYSLTNEAVESKRHDLVTLSWCQNLCKTSTYFTFRRRGESSTAQVACSCPDSLPSISPKDICSSICNGNKCGSATERTRKSLYATCSPGRYGSDPLCDNKCHCENNTVCDISDGNCTSGCQPHWAGNACNVCEINWEGANCDVCAQNWEGTNCDRCVSGWQDEDCLQDVDECRAGLCEQRCMNFGGGYNCSCDTGYRLESNRRNCTDCHFVEYTMPDAGVTSECNHLTVLEELPLADCFLEACRHGADVINYNMGPDLCDLRLCERQASGSYMITPGNKGWAVYVIDDEPTVSPSWVPVLAGVLAAVVVIAAAVAGSIYWWRRRNASRPTSGDDVIQSANQRDKIATGPSQVAVSNGEDPDKTYEEISQQSPGSQLDGPTSAGPRVSASYETIGPSVELNNPYDKVHIYSS